MIISRQILSLALVVLVIAGLSIYKFGIQKAWHPAKINMFQQGRVKGDPAAPVKIVEYTDFQCPACAAANTVLEDLFKKHEGKISLEHKHFPLPRHAHSLRASIFAECAVEQGKFWPMHDVLFKSQKSWEGMISVDAYFSELAVSLGLDGTRLAACVNSPAADGKVTRDKIAGQTLEVNATPTFFINGKRVVGGKFMAEEVEKLLAVPGGK
ncbi:MAG: DsbA family protein [Candidatus Omnitrophota bacterium]